MLIVYVNYTKNPYFKRNFAVLYYILYVSRETKIVGLRDVINPASLGRNRNPRNSGSQACQRYNNCNLIVVADGEDVTNKMGSTNLVQFTPLM